MENKAKELAKTWLPVFILFVIMFLMSVSMIMTRPVFHYDYLNEDAYFAPSALSNDGMKILGKMYVEQPSFYAGLGVLSVFSAAGAVWSVIMIDRKMKDEKGD